MYASQNKQRLFPYTSLSAVRAGSLNQTDPVSSLNGLEVLQLHEDDSEQIF